MKSWIPNLKFQIFTNFWTNFVLIGENLEIGIRETITKRIRYRVDWKWYRFLENNEMASCAKSAKDLYYITHHAKVIVTFK